MGIPRFVFTERRKSWAGRVHRIRDVWAEYPDGTRRLACVEAAYRPHGGGEAWVQVEEGSEYASMPVWDIVKRLRWPTEQWVRAVT